MSKYQVKRPGHLGEIERLDEQAPVADLASAAAAHEAPKLFLVAPALPGRLLLQGAEGAELSLSVNDLFHGRDTESADQLVLQICDAHVETDSFHVGAREVGAEARLFEAALELALLRGVTETRQPEVKPLRAEQIEEPSYGLGTSNWHNGNAFGVKIPTAARSERFERAPVADPFNEHDRIRVGACGERRLHRQLQFTTDGQRFAGPRSWARAA